MTTRKPLILSVLIAAPLQFACVVVEAQPETASVPIFSQLRATAETARATNDANNALVVGNLNYPESARIEVGPIAQAKYASQFKEAWRWWSLILNEPYRPADGLEAMEASPGAPDKDDLIVSRYRFAGGTAQIIDGRSITIVLSMKEPSKYRVPIFGARSPFPEWEMDEGLGRLVPKAVPPAQENELVGPIPLNRASIENYVHAVFRNAFRIDQGFDSLDVESRIECYGFSERNGGYGVVVAYAGNHWIMNGGITWWSDGKTVVFDVAKLLQPIGYKLRVQRGRQWCFGLPYDDKRRFSRFPESALDFVAIMEESMATERIKRYLPPPSRDTMVFKSQALPMTVQ